jgi:hypothetical protein
VRGLGVAHEQKKHGAYPTQSRPSPCLRAVLHPEQESPLSALNQLNCTARERFCKAKPYLRSERQGDVVPWRAARAQSERDIIASGRQATPETIVPLQGIGA